MTDRILLASDGGAASAAALRWVIDRVGAGSAEVEIVDASAADSAERAEGAEHHGNVEGMAALLRLVAPFAAVTVTAIENAPHALDPLLDAPDAVLVVGTRRRDRRATRFAELALTRARGPVVVVPSEWICRDGPVVVGIGAEDDLTATLAFAAATAAAGRVEVHLIHAWQTTGTGEIPPAWDFGTDSIPERQQRALARFARVARQSHPELIVTAEAVQGPVVPQLADAARTASLLVVGRSPRNAIVQAVFGSTARGLLAELPCPIAVIP